MNEELQRSLSIAWCKKAAATFCDACMRLDISLLLQEDATKLLCHEVCNEISKRRVQLIFQRSFSSIFETHANSFAEMSKGIMLSLEGEVFMQLWSICQGKRLPCLLDTVHSQAIVPDFLIGLCFIPWSLFISLHVVILRVVSTGACFASAFTCSVYCLYIDWFIDVVVLHLCKDFHGHWLQFYFFTTPFWILDQSWRRHKSSRLIWNLSALAEKHQAFPKIPKHKDRPEWAALHLTQDLYAQVKKMQSSTRRLPCQDAALATQQILLFKAVQIVILCLMRHQDGNKKQAAATLAVGAYIWQSSLALYAIQMKVTNSKVKQEDI